MSRKIFLALLVCSAAILAPSWTASEDLYSVLGVSKTASTQEIRTAYKHLVKMWHPEKNKDPIAMDRFTKINEAYETLGDPEKRSLYDMHGYTVTQEEPHPRKSSSNNNRGYTNFRSGPFGSYNLISGAESIIDKYMITQRFYETRIQLESFRVPYFIYAYADGCLICLHYEPLIEKLIKEIVKVGIGIGTIHVSSNRALGSNLRINEVPQIMAVVNGRITYFKRQVSMQNLRDFIRNLFPPSTIQLITDKNFDEFLHSWSDNRMRALFFSPREKPPLRFLMPAFSRREKIASRFVNTRSPLVESILRRYNVNKAKDTLLMVGESSNSTVAVVTMRTLSKGSIDEVMEANQYLTLPRLSSQVFFDELCPVEIRVKRRKLCVILVTKKIQEHDIYRSLFRTYVQHAPNFQERVKFLYLYEETQYRFVNALMNGSEPQQDKTNLKLAILWRMDKKHLNYEWVEPGWSNILDHNELTRRKLEKRLGELFTNADRLLYTAMLPDLHNEHALNLLVRIVHRFFDWFDRIFIFVTNYDSKMWLSMIFTLVSVVIVGFLMRQMLNVEMEKVMRQTRAKEIKTISLPSTRPPSRGPDNTLQLYELTPATYSDLVKEADPGFTITVLLDKNSQKILMSRFLGIMESYSNSNSLTFAYLQLDDYLGWYRHLLEESIEFRVQLSNINIRNCIGTVLAINGHRQYYYIYHAKSARKWMRQVNTGRTVGMFDSDSDSDDTQPHHILVEELLDGLDSWMDEIFDGLVRKIRVPYWPDLNL